MDPITTVQEVIDLLSTFPPDYELFCWHNYHHRGTPQIQVDDEKRQVWIEASWIYGD